MYQETMAANAAVPQNGTQTSFAMEEPAAETPGGAAAGQNSTAPMQETAADSADTTRAFSERLKAVSSRKVDEFIATGTGGYYLTDKKEVIVVSMGTGSF